MVPGIKNTMQPPCYNSVNRLSAIIVSFPAIGFSGSRHPQSLVSYSASKFLPSLKSYSGNVGVGCAKGVDHLVRIQFPNAKVFTVQPPVNRKAFALRSTRLVSWVSSSSGILVAFPSVACPRGVTPSKLFHGMGSGTWGSVALAVGIGVTAMVFIHTSLGSVFPASQALSCHFKPIGFNYSGYWWLSV